MSHAVWDGVVEQASGIGDAPGQTLGAAVVVGSFAEQLLVEDLVVAVNRDHAVAGLELAWASAWCNDGNVVIRDL